MIRPLSAAYLGLVLVLIQPVFSLAVSSSETSSTKMPEIKLTYFDIEGAAEPVRLALALAGQDYQDERIAFKDWPALKPKTPHGQMPLLQIDGGEVKTQSGAMLRWVGREFSQTLYPLDKLYEIEEAIGVVGDFQRAFQPCMSMGMQPQAFGYPEGFSKTDEGKEKVKALRKKFVENELPMYLGRMEAMLEASGGPWLVKGDNPTIADCTAIPFLRSFTKGHMDYVDTKCLDTHPKVIEYVKNFCALSQIKGRYETGLGSDKY